MSRFLKELLGSLLGLSIFQGIQKVDAGDSFMKLSAGTSGFGKSVHKNHSVTPAPGQGSYKHRQG